MMDLEDQQNSVNKEVSRHLGGNFIFQPKVFTQSRLLFVSRAPFGLRAAECFIQTSVKSDYGPKIQGFFFLGKFSLIHSTLREMTQARHNKYKTQRSKHRRSTALPHATRRKNSGESGQACVHQTL